MSRNKITVLLVDDEQPARRKLRQFLKDEEAVQTILEAKNGVEAVQLLEKKEPDLVLLDIQMPGMTGFEVVEAVGVEEMPPVIFVTAYDQYAIDAFEVQAVDYLLKPFDYDRFKRSFERALARIGSHDNDVSQLRTLLTNFNQKKKYFDKIMVNVGSRYFFVKTEEIRYIAAAEKYVELHLAKESYLIRETLNRIEERLDPDKFVRIHRSHIVNVDFIKEIQPWGHGDYVVIMQDGVKLNLSRRFRNNLFGKRDG